MNEHRTTRPSTAEALASVTIIPIGPEVPEPPPSRPQRYRGPHPALLFTLVLAIGWGVHTERQVSAAQLAPPSAHVKASAHAFLAPTGARLLTPRLATRGRVTIAPPAEAVRVAHLAEAMEAWSTERVSISLATIDRVSGHEAQAVLDRLQAEPSADLANDLLDAGVRVPDDYLEEYAHAVAATLGALTRERGDEGHVRLTGLRRVLAAEALSVTLRRVEVLSRSSTSPDWDAIAGTLAQLKACAPQMLERDGAAEQLAPVTNAVREAVFGVGPVLVEERAHVAQVAALVGDDATAAACLAWFDGEAVDGDAQATRVRLLTALIR